MNDTKTSPLTPPRIGAAWTGQGGVYAGIMRGENGAPDYHLIVPTDPVASAKNITWGGTGINQSGAQNHCDGLANTLALCTAEADHPAAQWAAALTIDGHIDLYLPARHELRLMYLNLPGLFETDDWYWSSTQYAATPGYAWMQDFADGGQSLNHKSNEYRARAVRRLLIIQ